MKEFGSLRQVFIPYLEKKIRQIYAFGEEITVRYLTFSENFTYVLYRGQKPIGIISLHKPGYHTPGELYDELVWMYEVRQETAVHVPQIFNGRNGGFLYAVTLPDDGGRYYFAVTEYLPGKTLESAEDECAEAWAERVGEITAMLLFSPAAVRLPGRSSIVSNGICRVRWERRPDGEISICIRSSKLNKIC
jgi:Ser/Thr protein kinase RdoA (MazF antagonist)